MEGPGTKRAGQLLHPLAWLQDAWKAIHGAFHVNIKRIGSQDRDARRLSRYIVAQYCGDQNALVRLSQSRASIPLARVRDELRRVVKNMPERYEAGQQLSLAMSAEYFAPAFNQLTWMTFRRCWDQLVRARMCEAFGVQLVWWDGRLQRV